jgi:hypothetical protein
MPESLGVLGVDCCEYFFLVFISVMVYGVMGLWGLLGSILARQLSSTAMGAVYGRGWIRWRGCKGTASVVIILHVRD